jgi:putative glutamine amidotransferase
MSQDKTKHIGIVGWSTGENSFGVTKSYLEYFSKFGIVEILTPQEGIREGLDLVVLPGGKDTPSYRYGMAPSFMNSESDAYKEYFFEVNLQQYIDAQVPIFGICLGMQQIAVKYGSVITQHMYHPYSSPRGELTHKISQPVRDDAGNLLYYPELDTLKLKEVAKNREVKVNSLHHQAVRWNNVGSDLEILYVDEDGEYVEALKHKRLNVVGVQWHPEEINDKFSNKTIINLLNGIKI